MSLRDVLRLAISRLAINRLRSALTMLGIVVGVASAVLLVAFTNATTGSVTGRLQALGATALLVTPGAPTTNGTRGAAGTASTLTLDDANALASLPGVAAVEPELAAQQLVVGPSSNTTTTIVGTTPEYLALRAFVLQAGQFISSADADAAVRVAVIGATTAGSLSLGPGSIDTDIAIGGIPFRVIGILAPKGSTGGTNPDDEIVIPEAAAARWFAPGPAVATIGVGVTDPGVLDPVRQEVSLTLRLLHGLPPAGTDDFAISVPSQLLDTLTSIGGTLTLLLAAVAVLALFIGGIGIMNIMLFSVRERTREIGIRKAVGATNAAILSQFLAEAVVLSAVGGLAGIVTAFVAASAVDVVAQWPLRLSVEAIVAATASSLLVGLSFGTWPAWRAARLQPIDALRYE